MERLFKINSSRTDFINISIGQTSLTLNNVKLHIYVVTHKTLLVGYIGDDGNFISIFLMYL